MSKSCEVKIALGPCLRLPFGIIESFVSATPPTKLWRRTIGQELLRERTECILQEETSNRYTQCPWKVWFSVGDCTWKILTQGGCVAGSIFSNANCSNIQFRKKWSICTSSELYPRKSKKYMVDSNIFVKWNRRKIILKLKSWLSFIFFVSVLNLMFGWYLICIRQEESFRSKFFFHLFYYPSEFLIPKCCEARVCVVFVKETQGFVKNCAWKSMIRITPVNPVCLWTVSVIISGWNRDLCGNRQALIRAKHIPPAPLPWNASLSSTYLLYNW